jgi:hypothetical protein
MAPRLYARSVMGEPWATHGQRAGARFVSSEEGAGQGISFGADDGIRARDPHLGNEAVIVHRRSHMFIAMGHGALIFLTTHSEPC